MSDHGHQPKKKQNALVVAVAVTIALAPILAFMYSRAFGPVTTNIEIREAFVVAPEEDIADVAEALKREGFIRNEWAFHLAFAGASAGKPIRPGGYQIARSMDMWTLADTLSHSPYLVFVTIPPGLRKEQIAERLARELSWSDREKEEWLSATQFSTFEDGMYYPDTYLIPSDQFPAKVALRMQDRFKEVFAPYAKEAARKGVAWKDVVTIASMIEREAAGTHDMELIAGIIWNRIAREMPLGIDATLQYIRGKEGEWWPVPKSEDKYLESPYNTYFRVGLPEGPIANPGLDTIKAALNPEETTCLYYLHDYRARIHCATNYQSHVANVDRYLR